MKICNYFKNIAEGNISQEFRLKNIDETRNYFLKETEQNKLMRKKQKKVYTTLNYIEQFLILASTVTWFISFSASASFLGIHIGIRSFAIGLNICAITAGIKKYKPITSHDEFVLKNNMLKEYDDIKEEIKNLKT